jgi:hypothetical protein
MRFAPSIRFLALAVVAVLVPRVDASSVSVPAGANLQEYLDRARPGDVLLLEPGATYVGNFILPVKPGTDYITIRTSGDGDGLPRPGQRVLPSHASRLAKLKSPNRQPVIQTAPAAHHWKLQLLEFLPTEGGAGDIITLGDGGPAQHELSQVPHDLAIDRVYVHGDAAAGQKRGIALNSASTTITNSYVADIKAVAQDTQAIAGWNGPGPYTIENNYLEGAGENFILGGSDPPISGLITQDVIFRRNHLAKPAAWRNEKWQVKNLFELKNAQRVLVEGNLMEFVWQEAQVGYAILLTPRNQDGKAPWVKVEDVTIRYNLVRHAGGGLQIIGEDSNYPSGSTKRVKISDNLFYDVEASRWGGTGAFVLIGEGPSDIAIEHNTVSQSGNILTAYGGTKNDPKQITGFVFRDNLIRHNEFGVHGADRGTGQDTLKGFFPDAIFQSNVIAGGDGKQYPGGNTFIADRDFESSFVNANAGDYRLSPSSRFRGSGSDGRDIGADVATIAQSLGTRTPRR